ncbi:MAG: hypothetical protein WC700_09030 [Gemmatimonadaceae bacterium]|jgi:hypothetical protein
MPLTTEEKDACMYHFGWPAVEAVAGINMGIPFFALPHFIARNHLDLLIESQVPRVRAMLVALNNYETQAATAGPRLMASALGNLTLRSAENGQREGDLIEAEYLRWVDKLSRLLMAPIHPDLRNRINAILTPGGQRGGAFRVCG